MEGQGFEESSEGFREFPWLKMGGYTNTTRQVSHPGHGL